MKNLLKKIIIYSFPLLLVNCSTEDKTIDIVLDNANSGATLRTIEEKQKAFDFNDTASQWIVTLEQQDSSNGQNFSSINVYASHTSGNVTSKEVLVKNIPATNFSKTGFNGYLRGDVSTSLAETLVALNLSSGEYFSSDKFNIRLEVVLKDGRTFSAKNNSPRILTGTYFKSPFEYSVQFSCPLADASIFNGDYKVVADAWADYASGDVVPVVHDSANGLFQFRILNTSNPYLVNGASTYIIVTVDPTDSSVKVTSNEPWDYGGGFITTVTGDGSVGSCTGDISLSLDFSGASSNQTLSLVKNN